MDGIGVGIGAAGFWIFIAAVIVVAIWDGAKKRETRQETLRRLMESDRDIDPATVDRILGVGKDRQDRDLKVAGMIISSVAAGMAGFGWFLGSFDTKAATAMYGIGLMLLCIGAGLFIAGIFVARAKRRDTAVNGDLV